MDNHTAESAAVLLFKTTLPKATLEQCAFILHHHSDLEDRWNLVAAEHERICSERIVEAVKAARVQALGEAYAAVSAISGERNGDNPITRVAYRAGLGEAEMVVLAIITAAENHGGSNAL